MGLIIFAFKSCPSLCFVNLTLLQFTTEWKHTLAAVLGPPKKYRSQPGDDLSFRLS